MHVDGEWFSILDGVVLVGLSHEDCIPHVRIGTNTTPHTSRGATFSSTSLIK